MKMDETQRQHYLDLGCDPMCHIEQAAAFVERARRICGCSACIGGYPIGEQTLALGPGEMRPSSCVANTILAWLLEPEPEKPER